MQKRRNPISHTKSKFVVAKARAVDVQIVPDGLRQNLLVFEVRRDAWFA